MTTRTTKLTTSLLSAAAVLVFALAAYAGGPAKKPAPSAKTSSSASLPTANMKSEVQVAFDVSAATPRSVEDTTEAAIIRDYGAAWTVRNRALDQNRADLLNQAFVGVAQQKLAEKIRQQKSADLHVRTVDHGHKLQAVFYSPEGSAMELHDTANLEIQYLEGDRVVGSEQVTAHYVALMTVTEDRWKVRLLQGE